MLDKKVAPKADLQDFIIDEEILKILTTPSEKRTDEDRAKLKEYYEKQQLERQKLENEIQRVEEELAKDPSNEELKNLLKYLKGLKAEFFSDANEIAKKQKLVAENPADIGLYPKDKPSKEHGIILVLKNDKNQISRLLAMLDKKVELKADFSNFIFLLKFAFFIKIPLFIRLA